MCGHAHVAEAFEASEASQLHRAPDRVVRAHRLAVATDLVVRDGLVEAQCGRQADGVGGAVGDSVAAPERLRHRVAQGEAGPGHGGAGVHGALQEIAAGLTVAAVCEHAGERARDEPGARESLAVRLLVPSLHVERLRAVGEGIQRRASGLRLRKPEGELDVVEDPRRVRPGAPRLHAPLLVPHAEERRPLRARVRGRDGEDREAGLRGDGLRRVDRAAAA